MNDNQDIKTLLQLNGCYCGLGNPQTMKARGLMREVFIFMGMQGSVYAKALLKKEHCPESISKQKKNLILKHVDILSQLCA